jgi:hypothetical protein
MLRLYIIFRWMMTMEGKLDDSGVIKKAVTNSNHV